MTDEISLVDPSIAQQLVSVSIDARHGPRGPTLVDRSIVLNHPKENICKYNKLASHRSVANILHLRL